MSTEVSIHNCNRIRSVVYRRFEPNPTFDLCEIRFETDEGEVTVRCYSSERLYLPPAEVRDT